MLFPPHLIEHIPSIITNKDDLHKENARIKQVLKENGYQDSIISKIFQRNTTQLSQSQQLMQVTDIQEEKIRMSKYLPYVEGASEKLLRLVRSHKVRSTFYTENTLRKLLCKPKDRVATEDNTKDLSGIAIVKRIKFLNTIGKQISTLAGIRRKLLIEKTS